MRHRKVSRRLTSTVEHRIALMRNQVRDLLKYGRITTTLAKAKELRRFADKMITLAKKGDLASRRRALAFIQDKTVVRKLFTELRDRYMDRSGGYTRVIKAGFRVGDASPMAIVELVEEKLTYKKSKVKSERLRKIHEFIERKKKSLAANEAKTTESQVQGVTADEITTVSNDTTISEEKGTTSQESLKE